MLYGFGNAVIKPLGSIDVAVCDREGREFLLLFYVTDIIDLPILGEHACDLLNLVKKVDSSDDDFVRVVHSLITNLPVTTVNFGYKRFRYKGFSLIRDYAKGPK